MQIAGSQVVPAASSSGGGVTASNFLAVTSSVAAVALNGTPAVVGGLLAYEGEGGPYLAIDGTTNFLSVLTAGIYVINMALQYNWVAQAGGHLNYFYASLIFTTADGSSLAANANWLDSRAYNEITVTTSNILSANLTTPPLNLAVSDKFQVKANTQLAPTASTAPNVIGQGLILSGVKIG